MENNNFDYKKDIENKFEILKKNYDVNFKLEDEPVIHDFYLEDIFYDSTLSLLRVLDRSSKILIVSQKISNENDDRFGKIKFFYDLDTNVLLEVRLILNDEKNINTMYYWGVENEKNPLFKNPYMVNIVQNPKWTAISDLYNSALTEIRGHIKESFEHYKKSDPLSSWYTEWI